MDAGETRKLPANLVLRNGIYHVRVQIDGKSFWRSTGKTTEREAVKRAHDIISQLQNVESTGVMSKEVPTFREWANRHREVYSLAKDAPERDDIALAPALIFKVKGNRTLGDLRLDEVTRSIAFAYLNHRRKTAAESTTEVDRRILGSIFERAIDDGLIKTNPFRRKKADKKMEVRPRIRPLALENEPALRAQLDPHMDRWLTFMLFSGLRIEESKGITLGDLDARRELIAVSEKYAKRHKAREVPLWSEALEVAREQHQAERRERGKLWFLSQNTYRARLAKAAKKASIPHLSPHDLRHTFAIRYLLGKGDIYVLSKILGHSSVATTELFYGHITAADVRQLSREVQMPSATASGTDVVANVVADEEIA